MTDLDERLARAIARRGSLAREPGTTAYRLVHREGDALTGVAVDRYGEVLVLHLYDDARSQEAWVEALVRAKHPHPLRAVYGRQHPTEAGRIDETVRVSIAPKEAVWGETTRSTEVMEGGVAYEARFDEGLSVGLFLDMREVRGWVRSNAAGKTVLNLFAYTCAFGVCAALGGAARVLNLDLSRRFLNWGQENYRLNDLEASPHDFLFGDVFDWLGRFARRDQRFDMVIVDPPSASTSRRGRFAVERDYGRLVEAAARVLADRGMLLAATNHAGITSRRFEALIQQGLARADRRVRGELGRWHEPRGDFPLAAGHHPYLKVVALEL